MANAQAILETVYVARADPSIAATAAQVAAATASAMGVGGRGGGGIAGGPLRVAGQMYLVARAAGFVEHAFDRAFGALAEGVRQAATIEQLHVQLRTLYGQDAPRVFQEFRKFAMATPFDLENIIRMGAQLKATGTNAQDIVPILTDVGDAVAAMGLPQENLERIIFNIVKIKNEGRLTARELMNMARAGLPVAQILKDELGMTSEQMYRIGDAHISADRAITALRNGLRNRYAGAMAEQMKTLNGRLSNLRDAALLASDALLRGWLPVIGQAAVGLSEFSKWLSAAPPVVQWLAGVIAVNLVGAIGLALIRLRLLEYQYYRTAIAALELGVAAKGAGVGGGGPGGKIPGGGLLGMGGMFAMGKGPWGTAIGAILLLADLGLTIWSGIEAAKKAGPQGRAYPGMDEASRRLAEIAENTEETAKNTERWSTGKGPFSSDLLPTRRQFAAISRQMVKVR